jgi:hypothetical protein
MIDLDEALAPLVERAPAPPAVGSVARRGRRHRRRRAAALAGAMVLVAVVAIGAIAAVAGRDEPRVLTPPDEVEHVRVTLLDGSQLDISGPASLGLADLPVSFNAELDNPLVDTSGAFGHSFSVSRSAPVEPGPIVGRYPTGDGHELVLASTHDGVDAVVRYGEWTLVVNWNDDPSDWAGFAAALDAHVTADGYLVVEAGRPGWRLGPTDSPDVQLGDTYAFFGPSLHRVGCPGVALDHFSRCDDASRVRIGALDRNLASTLDEINVEYAPGPGIG